MLKHDPFLQNVHIIAVSIFCLMLVIISFGVAIETHWKFQSKFLKSYGALFFLLLIPCRVVMLLKIKNAQIYKRISNSISSSTFNQKFKSNQNNNEKEAEFLNGEQSVVQFENGLTFVTIIQNQGEKTLLTVQNGDLKWFQKRKWALIMTIVGLGWIALLNMKAKTHRLELQGEMEKEIVVAV
ncbi:Hypothetical_protein [Hexamita inflata]|uniref:Hypothetical_protein n=1 Tax=Hexamita inflata TaxID=28002 RepID=A0AA86PER6_9EUKA|nr:Hypothetical protein HINF_LOCUS1902 [Hexamita inflata]CAI9934715.1 Hypothetical protein HINF_LOCUS22360 [Hexamita inflata]